MSGTSATSATTTGAAEGNAKEAKQRAFLAALEKRRQVVLRRSVPIMRYCCFASVADEVEAQVAPLDFVSIPSTAEQKAALMQGCALLDDVGLWMSHLYTQWLADDARCCDTSIEIELDRASLDYAKAFSKALDAKQTHAPGFDNPR